MHCVTKAEVAMLVANYLRDHRLQQTLHAFQQESKHLQHAPQIPAGRKPKTLEAILTEYIILKERELHRQRLRVAVRALAGNNATATTLARIETLLEDYYHMRLNPEYAQRRMAHERVLNEQRRELSDRQETMSRTSGPPAAQLVIPQSYSPPQHTQQPRIGFPQSLNTASNNSIRKDPSFFEVVMRSTTSGNASQKQNATDASDKIKRVGGAARWRKSTPPRRLMFISRTGENTNPSLKAHSEDEAPCIFYFNSETMVSGREYLDHKPLPNARAVAISPKNTTAAPEQQPQRQPSNLSAAQAATTSTPGAAQQAPPNDSSFTQADFDSLDHFIFNLEHSQALEAMVEGINSSFLAAHPSAGDYAHNTSVHNLEQIFGASNASAPTTPRVIDSSFTASAENTSNMPNDLNTKPPPRAIVSDVVEDLISDPRVLHGLSTLAQATKPSNVSYPSTPTDNQGSKKRQRHQQTAGSTIDLDSPPSKRSHVYTPSDNSK